MSDLIDFGATFSDDRVYRYLLWRIWDRSRLPVAFIGLNPSTADEVKNDPTVTRCIRYAERWGAGGLLMLNIFGFRSTDPKLLYLHLEPIGSGNDEAIRSVMHQASQVICACGTHGKLLDRWKSVHSLLQNEADLIRQSGATPPPICSLGTNQDGTPKHPLYLRGDLVGVEMK